MNLPNFLVIGAAKAGTGSLYQYIKQHPQIYMSPVKEPRFFAFEGETPNFSGPRDQKVHSVVSDIGSYTRLFQGVTTELAAGEASHAYLYYSEKAAHRIHHYVPDVKLIAILRNPIERAYSSFLFLHRQGREPHLDFMQAFRESQERLQKNWAPLWHYQQMGFYAKQLKPYFELFDQSQLKVYLYEDLTHDSAKLLEDLFIFLGVDSSFSPHASVEFNKSGIPKNKLIHKAFDQRSPWMKFMNKSPYIPKSFYGSLMDIYNTNLERPEIQDQVREYLIEIYRDDILNLQNLIGRDLSSWLEY